MDQNPPVCAVDAIRIARGRLPDRCCALEIRESGLPSRSLTCAGPADQPGCLQTARSRLRERRAPADVPQEVPDSRAALLSAWCAGTWPRRKPGAGRTSQSRPGRRPRRLARRRYFLTSISFVKVRTSVLFFLVFLRTTTVRVAVPFFGISTGTVTFHEQRPSSSGVWASPVWPVYFGQAIVISHLPLSL